MAVSPEKNTNLHKKYRLVIMDEHLREISSFKLSRMNVYMAGSSLIVMFFIVIMSLIVFTPLKYYIPGYGDVNTRRTIVSLNNDIDSLGRALDARDNFINSVKAMISDGLEHDQTVAQADKKSSTDSSKTLMNPSDIPTISKELSSIIESNNENKTVGQLSPQKSQISSYSFVHPLTKLARVTDGFAPEKGHYGIDLADVVNTPVKAILSGTVVVAGWSHETGWTIGIQHKNNFISFYKHNSNLLKKVGNFVKSGEVIAIIGQTGEQSTGPHLHLELWQDGTPTDPKKYVHL
jgi:murein DD-endopeptidase MepM/ murein hydrolase activator NlpD